MRLTRGTVTEPECRLHQTNLRCISGHNMFYWVQILAGARYLQRQGFNCSKAIERCELNFYPCMSPGG